MGNILSWFTKKGVLIITFLGSLIFLLGNLVDIHIPVDVCYGGAGTFCGDVSELLRIYFLPFVSAFLFSLITFRLKNNTFTAWRSFSVLFIPTSLFIISFLPTFTHGLDFVPIVKGTVIFVLTILYSTISLILIFYKSLKKE